MKTRLLFFALVAGCLQPLAAEPVVIAHDDASDPAYAGGWGKNGGQGFGEWVLRAASSGDRSHAGQFIGNVADNPELGRSAMNEKAFGFFANGAAFEQAVAFRSFGAPLEVGDEFSVVIEHGPFERKFEGDDPAPGAIGFTLRSGNDCNLPEDYNRGARFEFCFLEGEGNYQIYDGTEGSDSGVPYTDGGVKVLVRLVDADTYDVEITPLESGETTKLQGRKLGGQQGAKIDSLCLFDRDGEKHDAFFNLLEVRRAQP